MAALFTRRLLLIVVPTMAVITTAALVWLFVALSAKSDAESTVEDLRSDLSTSSQQVEAQSEELGELSDQLGVALSTADLIGSRWLAALSLRGLQSRSESSARTGSATSRPHSRSPQRAREPDIGRSTPSRADRSP